MEGELQRIVGRNLQTYRKQRRLSQEQFAHELGVRRTYMGSLERGERNLLPRSVERLADSLDMEPLTLLTPPSEQPPT